MNEKLVWSALEYEERERSPDWFWALGIIVVTSSLAALIYGNYFFAALLVLGGALLGFFAVRKPEVVTYELGGKGLVVGDRFYPHENIKSFLVQSSKFGGTHPHEDRTGIKPLLFIHSERAFMPVITIPIEETMAEEIRSLMLAKNIAEVEMKEHPSEKIMEALGF